MAELDEGPNRTTFSLTAKFNTLSARIIASYQKKFIKTVYNRIQTYQCCDWGWLTNLSS